MESVLVTGCSAGIGLATALKLAERGHKVFASMRDLSRAERLLRAADASSVQVNLVQLDVRDTDSIRRAVAEITDQGPLGVVVNNAAVSVPGPVEDLDDDEITAMVDTNVAGPFRLAKALIPHFRANRAGRFVNVSSIAARPKFGLRMWALYASSKAALHVMTYELAKELAPLGIDVVMVEAAVGGRSSMWDGYWDRTGSWDLDSSPYQRAQRGMTASFNSAFAGLDDGEATASMIAEACVVANPPLRFPPKAQRLLDAADALSDEDFLALSRYQDTRGVLDRAGVRHTLWEGDIPQ